MAPINPNRLHFLISALCIVGGITVGLVALMESYSSFSTRTIHQQQIRDFENRTGQSFEVWKKEQAVRCNREIAEQKGTATTNEYDYVVCMMPKVTEPATKPVVLPAFLMARGAAILLYVVVLAGASWLVGFLLTKGIPLGLRWFWKWLTAP